MMRTVNQNRGKFFTEMAWCAVLLAMLALAVISCKKDGAAANPSDDDYYTCTMHPSVRSHDPNAKCPICGMDLVHIQKKSAATNQAVAMATNVATDQPSEFSVPVARQQQIGVTFRNVETRPLHRAIRAVGTVAADTQHSNTVWVSAQFFQDDAPSLKTGLPATITTSSYPGEKFNAKIIAIDPFLNDISHTSRARIDFDTPDSKLLPGMYVDVELSLDAGGGLAVPVGAILPTGLHNIAFVDKGGGTLEPRFVELGREYGDFYEVKSGLKENERVVTSANFLIDAEAKIQGALKEW
jgi:multidrug efflux pump subunit AcrA (membrane-fusion protein)